MSRGSTLPAGRADGREMSPAGRIAKRGLDIAVAALGLVLFLPVIGAAILAARADTGASGLFLQTRIGRHGKPFRLAKIRTMRPAPGGTVTVAGDARITRFGAWLRRWKIDELPQLWNVLKGEMSLVGPRPDVPGYLDRLEGEARTLLDLRPGITGPATLKYRDEERLLAAQADPERYNDEVIWPDKVRLNLAYQREWSFARDLHYLAATLRGRTS